MAAMLPWTPCCGGSRRGWGAPLRALAHDLPAELRHFSRRGRGLVAKQAFAPRACLVGTARACQGVDEEVFQDRPLAASSKKTYNKAVLKVSYQNLFSQRLAPCCSGSGAQ